MFAVVPHDYVRLEFGSQKSDKRSGSQPRAPHRSEIGGSPVVAPFSTGSPSQGLILRPSHLARLRIDVSFELRRRPSSYVRMQLLPLPARLNGPLELVLF